MEHSNHDQEANLLQTLLRLLLTKLVLHLFEALLVLFLSPEVALNNISKVLSSQSFPSLYFHHPALLRFICGYNQLAEKFGSLVLELWLTEQPHHTEEEPASVRTNILFI